MFALPPKKPTSECVLCQKPLGQESKDLGYLTCKDHRSCLKCHEPLNAQEVKWCYDTYNELVSDGCETATLDLIHPRCVVVERPTLDKDPTLAIKQSEFDFLNLIRLSVIPDISLSLTTNENNAMIQSSKLIKDWDFDKTYAHLKMLEACVAQVSIAVSQNKEQRKKLEEHRDKEQKKKAQKEALTSSRPVTKSADDIKEEQLGLFMQNFGFKSRKTALTQWALREKSVKGFVACGIAEVEARKLVDATLLENVRKGLVKLDD